MKFAAIDVGSNAVRLLLSRVFEDGPYPIIKKESLVRVPIRLGEDAFIHGNISPKKIEQLIDTMIAFKYLIRAYQPLDTMACATAAMREANNSRKILQAIKKKSGIDLKIVDGRREAEIIYSTHIENIYDPARPWLYIDVGGGSTELTLLEKSKSVAARSFNIGTVRLLSDLVDERTWKDMRRWIKNHAANLPQLSALGSGGNINKIFRMSRIKDKQGLSRSRLKEISRFLQEHSLEDRIRKLGMRPDRADVVIPATEIYLKVMKWADIRKIYVPQIGLPDGLVRILYENYQRTQQSPCL
jgi:exopolyphosphatase/guanosine-5'-triphosphate,3'-diphosphate pyrophosphatase